MRGSHPLLGSQEGSQGSGNHGGQGGIGEVLGGPKDPSPSQAHPAPASRSSPEPPFAAPLWGGGNELRALCPHKPLRVPTHHPATPQTPLCMSPAICVSPPYPEPLRTPSRPLRDPPTLSVSLQGDSRCSSSWHNSLLWSCAFTSSSAVASWTLGHSGTDRGTQGDMAVT